MSIYLGLGANAGDRKANLERAIAELGAHGFSLAQVSPMVETPALLPADAEPDWHKPYFNLVVRGDAPWSPTEALATAKRIERKLGRTPGAKWSPRPIDIDILYWRGERIQLENQSQKLSVPHRDAQTRNFVLTPLTYLQPDLVVGAKGETAFALSANIPPIPLWMAIINLTPDSFSDGGVWHGEKLEIWLDELLASNAHIIDLGGESTRPGAAPVNPEQEWQRLQPVLVRLAERLRGKFIKPKLSLDSRHPGNVEKALDYGVEIVNDVSGLGDPEMQSVVKHNGCQVVAMHNLGIPADPKTHLPAKPESAAQIKTWAEARLENWAKVGLDLNRIILDPGIGFGKSSAQNLALLQGAHELRRLGQRLLIGHSRKSFIGNFSAAASAHRDLESVGVSLALAQQGVDILRVHEPIAHQRAYFAWLHAQPNQ